MILIKLYKNKELIILIKLIKKSKEFYNVLMKIKKEDYHPNILISIKEIESIKSQQNKIIIKIKIQIEHQSNLSSVLQSLEKHMEIIIDIKNQNYQKKQKSIKTPMIKKDIKLIIKMIDGKNYQANQKNINQKTN